MGLFDMFGKKKKNEAPKQAPANDGGFHQMVQELLARPDIQGSSDICKVVYNKAQSLLKNPTQESVHQAYDLMGNLASQFEYVPAIMWMGDFSENVMKKLDKAAYWYKKAADLGDGNGSRCYADMLMTGNGVQRDVAQAMHYYADAADKGVPEAAFVLGEFLRNNGDRENALKAYRQALAGGFAQAQIRIDQMNG